MAGFCTSCGTQRPDGARFCSKCGAAFDAAAVATDAAASDEVVSPAQDHHPLYPGVEDAIDEPVAEPIVTPPAASTPDIAPEPTPEPTPMPTPTPIADLPPAGMVPPAPAFAPTPPPYVTPDAPAAASRTPMLLGGLGLAALAVGGLAWWAFSDLEVNGIKPKQSEVSGETVVAEAPTAVPEAVYVDDFLSPSAEPMMTRGPVALMPVPGQSAAPALRSLPENAPITGRWVRGADGTSRWFRLESGGYLPAAAVIAARAVAPVVRPFNMREDFVNALMPYLQQASTQHRLAMEQAEKQGDDEMMTHGYASVPNRVLHGLTVTGAGSHYEGSSIIFRENATAARAAFRAAGWQVSSDGEVTVGPDDPVTCSIQSTAQWPDSARYGASELNCGL